MTEAEWLSCEEPHPMLEFLKGRAGDRKLRLFAVACCRHSGPPCLKPAALATLETAERYADRLIDPSGLRRSYEEAYATAFCGPDAGEEGPDGNAGGGRGVAALLPDPYAAARFASYRAPEWCRTPDENGRWKRRLTHLLGDIVGNPFRPVTFSPSRLATTVVDLARSIYDCRTFGRMPDLADALEATGCDDGEVLNHCRSGGEHVRGCWALDGVLGMN